MIFDAQVHVWRDPSDENPWQREWYQRAHRFPALRGPELVRMMDSAGVDRAVLVQPSWAGDDNTEAIAAATEHPDRFVVMARLPLTGPESRSLLDEFAESPVVAGVRLTFHRPEMEAWLTDGSADWLWPALVERGLRVMIYAPGRNAEIARIATQFPDLPVVVDALGFRLGQVDDELAGPLRQLDQLADLPNVALKATALPAHVTDSYPYPRLGPILRGLFDRFGSHRVMWASDLTRVTASYDQIAGFAAELGVLDDREIADFMGGNLSRWLQHGSTFDTREAL
jgi:L-fuconolactonase